MPNLANIRMDRCSCISLVRYWVYLYTQVCEFLLHNSKRSGNTPIIVTLTRNGHSYHLIYYISMVFIIRHCITVFSQRLCTSPQIHLNINFWLYGLPCIRTLFSIDRPIDFYIASLCWVLILTNNQWLNRKFFAKCILEIAFSCHLYNCHAFLGRCICCIFPIQGIIYIVLQRVSSKSYRWLRMMRLTIVY